MDDREIVRGGVTTDVHRSDTTVHHVDTATGEVVDRTEHGLLVPGDEARGEDDEVALAEREVTVIPGGHQAECAERLTLRTRRDDDELRAVVPFDVLHRDLELRVELQVTELARDRHVVDHRATDEDGSPAERRRDVEDLLDAVHV